MTSTDFDQYFPFSSIRDEQRKAIEFVLSSFKSGKKFVVAELGTGVGKSAIAVAVARYMNASASLHLGQDVLRDKAYVLTTQKILQEQYERDFGPRGKDLIRNIKSASNYACVFYKEQSCGESRRILNRLQKQLVGTDFWKCCKGGSCTYQQDKKEFIDSPIGITNFSYFLAETKYAGALEPRKLLVIDECHNTPLELSKFIEVSFSERFARDTLKCDEIPSVSDGEDGADEKVFAWIKEVYKPSLARLIEKVEKQIKKKNSEDDSLKELGKHYEMLDKHICKVNRFIEIYDKSNWILNVVINYDDRRGLKRFEFKPIDVSRYAEEMLYKYGEFVLFLSATVINKDAFCRSIGLNPSEVAFINIPSPFPAENRLVNYIPVGRMSANYIDATLPKMAEMVETLLELHRDEKGIIHSVSFKVAKYIMEHVKSDRLMMHDSLNRDQVLREHKQSDRPTVIISPSMSEGVDLADESSRFQVICKVPFPYLGDRVIQKRKELDKDWYAFQTAKTIIQSLGRSIRNKDDFAVSYILDGDWENFYRRNRHLFPQDFHRVLRS